MNQQDKILTTIEKLSDVIKTIASEKISKAEALQLIDSFKNSELVEIRKLATPVKGFDYFDGEKGEKGDKGDKGDIRPLGKEELAEIIQTVTPVKGLQYFDGQKGEKGDTGPVGPAGKDGKNGRNGITKVLYKKIENTVKDLEQLVVGLEALPIEKRLDAIKLRNIEIAVQKYAIRFESDPVWRSQRKDYVKRAGDTMLGDLNFEACGINTVDYIDANLTATSTPKVGRMRWNATDKCWEYDSTVDSTIVTNQLGQEVWVRVRNNTGAVISNGNPVYVSGALGNRPTIALAKADSEATSLTYIGLTTEHIHPNEDGFVTVLGSVRGLNTNAYEPGTVLYVSPTTAGGLTSTRPVAPNVTASVGIVTVKGANGEIMAQARIQPTLDRLSNVNITSIADKNVIQYMGANLRWENKTRTEAGIVGTELNNSLTGTNKFGSATNYLEIDNAGQVKAVGTASWFDDLRVEPTVRAASPKSPAYTVYKGAIFVYLFDDAVLAAEKEVNFKMQLPHGWKTDSPMHLHLHWIPITTGTAGQKVRWGLEYTKAPIGGTFGNPVTIYADTPVNPPSTTPTADTHYLTEFPDIDLTGMGLSGILLGRVFRNSSDADDTYTGSAGLLYIDAHIELDQLGSNQEFIK